MWEKRRCGYSRLWKRKGNCGRSKARGKDRDHGSCGVLWEEQCPVGMTGHSGKTRVLGERIVVTRGIVGENADRLLLEQNERNHVECT